ncbi:MAG TPA: hypothetical protein HA254_04600, partial [Candidatus Diapherotrites archaeon]|nr:hypothetical protein [Candidatus Diapherotrites archaeon]
RTYDVDGRRFAVVFELEVGKDVRGDVRPNVTMYVSKNAMPADLSSFNLRSENMAKLGFLSPWHRQIGGVMYPEGDKFMGKGLASFAQRMVEHHIKENWQKYENSHFLKIEPHEKFLLENTNLVSALSMLRKAGYEITGGVPVTEERKEIPGAEVMKLISERLGEIPPGHSKPGTFHDMLGFWVRLRKPFSKIK